MNTPRAIPTTGPAAWVYAREKAERAQGQPAGPATQPIDPRTRRQSDFAVALGKRLDRPGEAPSPEEKARRAAEDFVAVALVQPVLKQLREANQAAEPFKPGPAEKQFRGLADAMMARQIVGASSFPLVDRLAQDMLKRGGAVPPVPANALAINPRPAR
jgi:Rod binding domain-containing protein